MLSAEIRSTVKSCLPAPQIPLTRAGRPQAETQLAAIKSPITIIFRIAGAKSMDGSNGFQRK